MNTWQIWLFGFVFLMQIVLISYVLAGRLLARMDYVLEHYPQADYPRLYPRSADVYRIGQALFKWSNRIILLLGLLLLAVLTRSALKGNSDALSDAWPALFALLQVLPLIFCEFAGFKQYRLMRRANTARTRQAPLQRRRLTNYIHPRLLALVAGSACAAVLLDLWANGFALAWGSDTMVKAFTLVLCNGFLAAMGAWHVYGKKLDPHQDWEDHHRQTGVILRSFVFVSLAASAFFAIKTLESLAQLPDMDAVLISLYMQVIALVSLGQVLRSTRPEQFNFEVYRAPAERTASSNSG